MSRKRKPLLLAGSKVKVVSTHPMHAGRVGYVKRDNRYRTAIVVLWQTGKGGWLFEPDDLEVIAPPPEVDEEDVKHKRAQRIYRSPAYKNGKR